MASSFETFARKGARPPQDDVFIYLLKRRRLRRNARLRRYYGANATRFS
jgi:hypothetical protein